MKILRTMLILICLVITMFHLSAPMNAEEGAVSQVKFGTLKGKIVDEDVQTAVAHATVKIKGTELQALTDYEGQFEIPGVPVGSYVLEVSCQYYLTKLHPDVVIKSARISFVELSLKLSLDMQEHEEVTVTAGYYSDTKQKSTSMTSFSNEEIRRAAGSAGDVSRIVSGLPSIARVNDQVNGLVVRGGNPVENGFYLDNIPIPNINHYPVQGSSSGVLALLNVDFINDVNFYSGGFSPIYGNRLSSVMDINFRKGNQDEYDFQADFSMAGFGLIAEGPLPGARNSWMISGRHSYLDLIDKYFDIGVSPSWGDIQGKATFDLSSSSSLSLLGVWGDDKSGWDRDKSLELGDSSYGYHNARNSTLGFNWFKAWGANGYSNTSLSSSNIKYDIYYNKTDSDALIYENNSLEQAYTFRNVNHLRVSDIHKFTFGLEVQYLKTHNDYALGAGIDVSGNPYPDIHIDVRKDSGRYAGFLNYTLNPVSRLSLNLGVRIDHLSFNRNTNVSPRFSLSYGLSSRTSLNAAAGVFFQNLPSLLLLQNEAHSELKDPMAIHYVLGLSHLLTDTTRFTLEAYYKDYRHMPLDPMQPGLFILDEIYYSGFYTNHERLVDTGRAHSYGVEVMIQKKLATRLYGLVSASYFRTFYQDQGEEWRPRVYDNKFIVSIEGGYRPGRFWELSCKWQYAGGMPYTPFDLEASEVANSGIFDLNRINGERLESYHSLNLRVDKRLHFGGSNLTLYFSVWNMYNQKNVAFIFWNSLENRPDTENQWGLLPILGIEFEF